MSRRLPALVAMAFLVSTVPIHAQRDVALALAVVPILGRIDGVVRDQAGRVVPGAMVIAVGGRLTTVRSGMDGRYTLTLGPGRYVLRASREGYLSTYRESVDVETLDRLERNITLVRRGATTLPPAGQEEQAAVPGAVAGEDSVDGHSHSDTAWRLRHLRRSVLRDEDPDAYAGSVSAASYGEPSSWLDRAVTTSARAAASFFSDTDIDGQVHLLTATDVGSAPGGGRPPGPLSRGIAYAAVRADAGSHGAWAVRGAVTATSAPSWVIVGEYAAHDDAVHALRAAMSFGVQSDSAASERGRPASASDSRHVGALFAADRWQAAPRLVIDYGLRLERFGYLPDQSLASPHVTVQGRVLPATAVVVMLSRRATAPGSDEFLPPSTDGPWLPPDRTFSALIPGTPFDAERVRHVGLGVEHQFGSTDGARALSVSRFSDSIEDQTVVLFGVGRNRESGHYRVAALEGGTVDGWAIRLVGEMLPRVEGSVRYVVGDVDWAPGSTRALGRLTPSAARSGPERLHDLMTEVETVIDSTATRILFVHRVSNSFSHARQVEREPSPGQRFAIDVRQGLPYRPFQGGRLDLVVSIRNLFRDSGQVVSLYDELLTVNPPLRFTAGVQVRF